MSSCDRDGQTMFLHESVKPFGEAVPLDTIEGGDSSTIVTVEAKVGDKLTDEVNQEQANQFASLCSIQTTHCGIK